MKQLRFTCYKFCYILLQLLPLLYSINAVHVEHDKLSVKRLKFLKVFEMVQCKCLCYVYVMFLFMFMFMFSKCLLWLLFGSKKKIFHD